MVFHQNWRGYAPGMSKFTKIREFQTNVYANLRLLNDYGLIISIRTNKIAYVCVYFIFKIGDATRAWIYFPILARTLKWFFWNLRIFVNLDISGASRPFNFDDRSYVDTSFFVCSTEFYHTYMMW